MKNVMRSAVVGKLIMCILLATLITATGAYAEEWSLDTADWGNIDWQQFAGTKLKALNINMTVVREGYTAERMAQFERLTGIKMDMEITTDPDIVKKLAIDFAARKGEYDVVSVGLSRRELYAVPGYLEDLQKYLDNPKLTDKEWYNIEDIYSKVLQAGYASTGKLVMIPYTAEYFLLHFQRPIFEKLGLSVPTTFGDLRATAEKINQARNAGLITQYAYTERGLPGLSSAWNLFCTARRFNVELVDFDGMVSNVNTPQAHRLFEYYTSMITDFGPPGSSTWSWPDISTAMKEDLIAMCPAGQATRHIINDPKISKVVGKFGVAPPPMAEGGKDPLWCWAWGISYASKVKDAAWLFVQWATSPALARPIAIDYGNNPRMGPYYLPVVEAALPGPDYAASYRWMLQYGIDPAPVMFHVNYGEAADIISREVIGNVLAGIKTVKQAAADADELLMKLGYTPFETYKAPEM